MSVMHRITRPGPEVPRIMDVVWTGDVKKQREVVDQLHKWMLAEREKIKEELNKLPNVKEFYTGRDVFVTGASGFLGRVYLEHLLYYCPDVRHVYLLLRAKKGVSPEDRIKKLTDVPLFDRLKREQPDALKKVVVLPGDCSELGLGLSPEHRQLLEDNVSLVMHIAASVRFDDPVKKAVLLNLRGTGEIVELAKRMKQLLSFIHISTAYTNINQDPVEERVYRQELDWRMVIKLAERDDCEILDNLGPLLLGFHANTYTWTKALAEDIIDEVNNILPVGIIRPTIVMSSIYDPFCGWIDNINGPGGLFLGLMTGVVRVLPKGGAHWDLVPVDICAKTMVVGQWMRAVAVSLSPNIHDTQVAHISGAIFDYPDSTTLLKRGMRLLKSGACFFPSAIRFPFALYGLPTVLYAPLFFFYHILFALVVDSALRLSGRKPRLLSIYRRMVDAIKCLQKFDRDFHFRAENNWAGLALVHPDDDGPGKVYNWEAVMYAFSHRTEMYKEGAKGLSKYIMKSKEKDHETAARWNYWLLFGEVVAHLIFFWLVYTLYCWWRL